MSVSGFAKATLTIEDDPDLTDKKFPGNPTKSYRAKEPCRVALLSPRWRRSSSMSWVYLAAAELFVIDMVLAFLETHVVPGCAAKRQEEPG